MNDNSKHRKQLKHYDIPGHAHELTFSCYHSLHYFNDPISCNIFIEELRRSKELFQFRLWAYVIMPSHVHLLIYPCQQNYKIADILQTVKGRTSKRYGEVLLEKSPETYERYCIRIGDKITFRFWQAGGGFDRNFWSPEAIHNSINYIERNPVQKGLVKNPEDWEWSSARARFAGKGLVPDDCEIPMLMK